MLLLNPFVSLFAFVRSYVIAIGIDPGHTGAYIAYYNKKKVDIMTANGQAYNSTPCYVYLSDSTHLIGKAATKNQRDYDCINTVLDAKRQIGRIFDKAKHLQSGGQCWPFDVLNKDHIPYIQVKYKGSGEYKASDFDPTEEEISAMVLQHAKRDAEQFLGEPITKAVLTVPSYFNDAERLATREVGKQAGLEVLRLVNKPTAAAIAYKLDISAGEKEILVFHLGRETLAITLLEVDDGVFDHVNAVSDLHLGGDTFTNRLVEHFAKEFESKYNKDLRRDSHSVKKLWSACEKAKVLLSTADQASIEIEALHDGMNFNSTISRSLFEEMNQDIFSHILGKLDMVLKEINFPKDLVQEIVLSGGSAHIPKIQELVSEFFNHKKALLNSINPEEVVGYGAAIQADLVAGVDLFEGYCGCVSVLPLSVGIETAQGVMSNIVRRNWAYPTKKSILLTTVTDYQSSVILRIFEGERIQTKDNRFLGELTLSGLPLVPQGVPEIEVIFDIGWANLTVSAIEKSTGVVSSTQLVVSLGEGLYSNEELERLLIDAELHKEEDDEYAAIVRDKPMPKSVDSACQEVIVRPSPVEHVTTAEEVN